jgi:hypothetical protein
MVQQVKGSVTEDLEAAINQLIEDSSTKAGIFDSFDTIELWTGSSNSVDLSAIPENDNSKVKYVTYDLALSNSGTLGAGTICCLPSATREIVWLNRGTGTGDKTEFGFIIMGGSFASIFGTLDRDPITADFVITKVTQAN